MTADLMRAYTKDNYACEHNRLGPSGCGLCHFLVLLLRTCGTFALTTLTTRRELIKCHRYLLHEFRFLLFWAQLLPPTHNR